MLTAAYLALCVQVADLSALYLSFEPSGATMEEETADAGIRWSQQLRQVANDDAAFVAAMHDGFRDAMALDGAGLGTQWTACVVAIDAADTTPDTPTPGGKG